MLIPCPFTKVLTGPSRPLAGWQRDVYNTGYVWLEESITRSWAGALQLRSKDPTCSVLKKSWTNTGKKQTRGCGEQLRHRCHPECCEFLTKANLQAPAGNQWTLCNEKPPTNRFSDFPANRKASAPDRQQYNDRRQRKGEKETFTKSPEFKRGKGPRAPKRTRTSLCFLPFRGTPEATRYQPPAPEPRLGKRALRNGENLNFV